MMAENKTQTALYYELVGNSQTQEFMNAASAILKTINKFFLVIKNAAYYREVFFITFKPNDGKCLICQTILIN